MGKSLTDENICSKALLHKYVYSKESHNLEKALEKRTSQTQERLLCRERKRAEIR